MTSRLLSVARRNWAAFDGLLASRNIDPLLLPTDRLLNLLYWWATRNAGEQRDLDKFDRQLWMPPKGTAPAPGSPWSPEAETASFAAFAAEVGVGVTGAAKKTT